MIGQHRIHIAGSIGLAFYPDDGLCVDDMMINADAAMYQAKARGGGAYQCFHLDMDGLRTSSRGTVKRH